MLSTLLQNTQEGAEVITDGESVEKTLSIIEFMKVLKIILRRMSSNDLKKECTPAI